MEEYYSQRNLIPTFGNWEWNEHLPFTQCFESSKVAGFPDAGDLYVAGDLYQNDVVTPAMIVVPRSSGKRERQGKQRKKESCGPVDETLNHQKPIIPKPVDEDLYKISPHLLCANPKKKRGLSYLTNCFVPTCLI